MMEQRVRALLSDYDGTLVPTANVKNPKANSIPRELEEMLMKVSSEMPVCVISTKDFEFLRKRTVFARVILYDGHRNPCSEKSWIFMNH
jgi:trehalose-6-phosphatase